MRQLYSLLAIALLPSLVLAQDQIVPGIVILKVKPEHEQALVAAGRGFEAFAGIPVTALRQKYPTAEKPGGRKDRHGNPFVDLTRIYQLSIPETADVLGAVRELSSTGFFEWAEPTTYSESFYVPNDPNIGSQDYLTQINAYAAWDSTQGDTNVVMGITDTSFDLWHQDLYQNVKYNYADPINGLDDDGDGYVDNFEGWDIWGNDNNLFVHSEYHGTMVAAVAAASTDNGVGIAGVGFNCKFLPVKIGNDATASQIMTTHGHQAIYYCALRNCKVINCSWGTLTFSNEGQDVVNFATVNRNALVVAAAGNASADAYRYPASFNNVLSVTGVHNNDVFNNGSNPTFTYSDKVDLCAQGFNVYTTATSGGQGIGPVYTTSGGSSLAAPQVSGAAALVRSLYPCLSAIQTAELLINSAVDIEGVGTNSDYAGKIGKRLDILAAMQENQCLSVSVAEEAGLGASLRLIPNPASGMVTVSAPNHSNWQLAVSDLSGREVMAAGFEGQEKRISLPAGVYVVCLSDGGSRLTQRLVMLGNH